MKRRDFISFLAGAAAAWPRAARAQPGERVRRIGVLMALAPSDPEAQLRVRAFEAGLRDLGWSEGRNLRIDYRWAPGDAGALRAQAAELIRSTPDLILAHSTPVLAALRQDGLALPIVFVQVTDPVGGGFVPNFTRPGGHVTGFTSFEFTIGSKWLEALKQIAPRVTRVLALLHVETLANAGFLRAAQSAASSLGVTLTAARVHNATEIETAMMALSAEVNCGLMVMPHPVTTTNRAVILKLAAQYRLPAVYPIRYFVAEGGLMSYGIDLVDLYRRAATYVDRILRGAQPRDLPVQAPSKFEMVINLKTAKALGLDVPLQLQELADDVIE